jgi:hypothetical protein
MKTYGLTRERLVMFSVVRCRFKPLPAASVTVYRLATANSSGRSGGLQERERFR